MSVGGAPAGIYTTCSATEVSYILSHAESKLVLLEDDSQWQKVAAHLDGLPALVRVVCMQGLVVDHPLAQGWDAFLQSGSGVTDAQLAERMAALKPDQLATLIYTSGTTGPPKGVMLSHRNLTWTADAALKLVPVQPDHCSLSYLPLSHIAEQMFSIHLPISAGSHVYFAESMAKLKDNLVEVQPNVVFGVPRVWEKFYAGLSAKLGAATGGKAKLVGWARGVATQVHTLKNKGQQPGGWLGFQYAVARKLVFSKMHPLIGLGRAMVCVSGAAPVSKDILDFFASVDVPIREVYGQSEGSGPTTFNAMDRTRFGSVGPAIPGCDVKIAADGEICLRGPNVFLGYFKDQVATDECLIDGWLHSGDLGAFDDAGFLTITGRKKDILITAGGKNIAPKNLEGALKQIPMVADAVVIGDRRKFLTALLTLDPEQLQKAAEAKGMTPAALRNSAETRAAIQAGVDAMNRDLAQVETVKKFTVLPEPFSPETGELTPSLKVKRKVVNEKFAAVIDAMYAE
ncbi:MAG: long-chain fatty acid--CoA ligase [Myxococcales bacterium]|nr:long-chain fatty acid--CoA ligase [Myxococcales bacterium]